MQTALHDATNQSNARLRLLSGIATELLLNPCPHDILQELLERLSAHLELGMYFNYLVDEDDGRKRLRLNCYGGINTEQAREIKWLEFGQALCGLAATEGRCVSVEDLQNTADPGAEFVRSFGITAYVCHPMIAQGRILGTLSFGTSSRIRFTEDELEIFQTISNQIAMALERFRLTSELERRASELAAVVKNSEASYAQLQAVVSSMSEGVIITNLEGNPMMMNPAALEMLGLESIEEAGNAYGDYMESIEAHYLDGIRVPREEWPVQRIARGEHFSDVEMSVLRPATGASWIASISGRPVWMRTGEIVLAVITIRDVTVRKMVERELKEAKEAAEAANIAKDKFLAILSHELRTPLTPVLTLAQALEGEMGLPAEFRPYVEIIRRNVELEVLLIDDMLDLTRIAKGKLKLHMEELDLHGVILRVLDICKADIESRNLRLDLDLRASNTLVCGDATRLQQVFWNLLKNAVKFTGEGGRISVTTENIHPDRVRVDISDSGIGIRPEHLPHIFNAFEQGTSTMTKRFGGLGLGLAITKALVENHGGFIQAQSEGEGRGTTFSVVFTTLEQERDGPEPGDLGAFARGRVLVVDGVMESGQATASLLEQEGFQVHIVQGVGGGLQATAALHFDLLICNYRLPDGTGIDFIRNLNLACRVMSFILVEPGMEEAAHRSVEAGYTDYLVSPIDPERLRGVLNRIDRWG